MKNKKMIGVALSVFLVILSLAACQKPVEVSDLYNFENYENSVVFGIKKVDLSGSLAQSCVSYKFTYYSDDYQIKGYLSIPASVAGTQKSTKCILYNRGGNRDYGILEDETTAKICSAIGDRIVIASQYRGGGGSQGTDEFGGDDLHDVIKLIDLCESQFSFVDMDDFCVAGASRGGMMTYLTARQDSRVKRIVAMSAVSDLFQSYEDREDMKEVMLETIGSTPEEAPDEYKKRSAIYWYDEIKVPVLMIHSKKDELVAYSQAEALYEKMKDTTDCTFITHDDNVHGPHQEDFDTIRDWLSTVNNERL